MLPKQMALKLESKEAVSTTFLGTMVQKPIINKTSVTKTGGIYA